MFNSACVCSVNFQARALCAQTAATERHRFIVGTCSLHDSNELSVLQYSEDSNHFEISSVYSHPDQILCCEASPKDPSLVLTSRQAQNCAKALSLWHMPKQSLDDMVEDSGAAYNHEQEDIREVASFNQSHKPAAVRSMKWHHRDDTILTADGKLLSTWAITESKISQANAFFLHEDGATAAATSATSTAADLATSVAWDPHSSKQCAVSCGDRLQLVDTREMEVTGIRQKAHDGCIRSVDFNPNKQMVLITAGDDRKIKFWDSRKFSQPMKVLAGHSHWVYSAKFNPHHDQLIVSGGSDSVVNLWRIASCSSAPWLGSEDNSNDPPDVKVRCIDQHEDSVYGVAWSPADPWIYCSLSFDGRVMVNHVPSTEKYKILL